MTPFGSRPMWGHDKFPFVGNHQTLRQPARCEGCAGPSKNIHIDNGVGHGGLELNATLGSGNIIYRPTPTICGISGRTTTICRNRDIGEAIVKEESEEAKYDVQLLPESGHLLEGIENVMGIKALVNGSGVSFSGKIMDNLGKTVASFKDGHLGMAQCKFFQKKGNGIGPP